MRKEIGIWLDTSKAVLVNLLDGEKGNVRILESEVESRTRFPGERKTSRVGSLLTNAEKKLVNRKKQQKNHYYHEIIKSIDPDVKSLYIFGPSTSKIELEKEIKKTPALVSISTNLESADKMTEKQMIAKVKDFFDNHTKEKYAKATH